MFGTSGFAFRSMVWRQEVLLKDKNRFVENKEI